MPSKHKAQFRSRGYSGFLALVELHSSEGRPIKTRRQIAHLSPGVRCYGNSEAGKENAGLKGGLLF